MDTVRFMDVDVPVFERACSLNGAPMRKVERPYVNFYVRVTDLCSAECGFCPYHKSTFRMFDTDGFKKAYDKVAEAFWINKVALTGGEPTLHWGILNRVTEHVKRVTPDVPITLNTNGHGLHNLSVRVLDRLQDIALSVHHYTDRKNKEIFMSGMRSLPGMQSLYATKMTPHHVSIREIRDFPEKEKLHLRCNIIKGYIDSPEEVMKYMTRFANMGVRDFGFVSLMGVNNYSKEHFVSYRSAGLDRLPNSRRVECRVRSGCSCQNHVFRTAKGRLVRFYTRTNTRPGDCRSTLVWDQDRLNVGFNGGRII